MEHILIVDDNKTTLKLADQVLKPYYKTTLLTSAIQSFNFLLENTPDLILLDINIPDMNECEILNTIESLNKSSKIPVIFLTSSADIDSDLKFLKLGTVDFIVKPFSPALMLTRINTHLELAKYRQELEFLVCKKTEAIKNLQDSIVVGLAELVECRDGETGGHIKRTAKYIKILVLAMVEKGVYSDILTEEYVQNILRAAPLHDIGKIGISDNVLLKQGSFDDNERDYMKQHTTLGGIALQKIIEVSNGENFLYIAKDIALFHHEKWNGTGYPYGLSEYNIPLCARIMAIVDVYDALTSERVYKKPFSHEKAVEIILSGTGTHFEPCIVYVFKSASELFHRASHLYNQKLHDI